LDVPIFCVDYSLAPENRFPRQLEEVYYAYCWALKNCRLLGMAAFSAAFMPFITGLKNVFLKRAKSVHFIGYW